MTIEADIAVLEALPDFLLCHMEVVEVEVRLVVVEVDALQSSPSCHMGLILAVAVEAKAPGLRRMWSCSPHLAPLYGGVPRPAPLRVPGALPWESI
jgi:hypothetical protein